MRDNPKSIETIYNGYRFRSRLEARWAVFFDMLGIKYEYEKEGFDLDGTWYLPDFWLTQWECWAEIKPNVPSEQEGRKCCALAKETGYTCLLLYGQPWSSVVTHGYGDAGNPLERIDFYYGWQSWDYRFLILEGNSLDPYKAVSIDSFFLDPVSPDAPGEIITPTVQGLDANIFAICRRCPAVNFMTFDQCYGALQVSGYGSMEKCCDSEREPLANHPRLIKAYIAARQARFEHGESPWQH